VTRHDEPYYEEDYVKIKTNPENGEQNITLEGADRKAIARTADLLTRVAAETEGSPGFADMAKVLREFLKETTLK
jgi:hypothetical protein